MGKKYAALGEYLDSRDGDGITLSFAQIEAILGDTLPKSAVDYDAWWSNTPAPGRHNHIWLSRGWETADLNRAARTVRFTRVQFSTLPLKTSRGGRAARSTPLPLAMLGPAPIASSNDVALKFGWKFLGRIAFDAAGKLRFPAIGDLPGLYRIRINREGGSQFYIGESRNLHGRFRNYRSGPKGQATSHRIHLLLMEALASGACVEVDIVADSVELKINDVSVSADLTKKATRCMIEHAAIVATGGIDIEIANK